MRKLAAIFLVFLIAASARAAVIATASGTSFASTAAVDTFTLNRPANVLIGDLLVVQITLNTSSISVTPPAAPMGWTQLRVDTNSGSGADVRQYVFYRIATADDTANGGTSWSLSNDAFVAAAMVGFRSDLGGRSIVIGAHSADSGNSATLTGSSVNAAAPGLLLRFFGYARGSTSFASSGLNRLVDASTSGTTGGASLLFATRTLNAAGATGANSATSANSARWLVQSLLLSESTLSKPTTCYTENFSSAANFIQNWATTSVGSTAFTPAVTNGRLRLTSNNGYISTAATLQRLFPTSNLIYVEFDYYSYPNASGADGVAVTLSDASITPQAGGFGGSLGYAQRSDGGGIAGFAGGWVGIALDEYGNFSNPTEGRNGGPGFRVDSVSIRGSGSGLAGYPYVAGTAANLSPGVDSSNTPGPGHRYRIVIDAAAPGQTYITVDRDTTGGGYANLIPTFNVEASAAQATIPANLMLSFTGSTGGSSNTHEIGNLSVCATAINTTAQVDHFEFTHDGQGLTCEPENVTIRACANADCSTLMSVPVTLTLNPGGWVGGNTHTINGSATLQLRRSTAGTAGISVASSSPGARPFSTNRCNGASTNTCNLPFVDAGLAFDVPNLVANRPSGPVRLRALRNSGDSSNACVALLQNAQTINFWSTYTTPASGTRAVELRAGSGGGSFAPISGNSAAPTALNLNFNSNGEAVFEARYSDAGLMALNARFTADPAGAYSGLVLNGSDSFVSTPAGFCVRGAQTGAPATYLSCTANYANCPVFAAAGNPFVLNIAAAGWESDSDSDYCTGNGSTPNYAQNSLALGSQVVAPLAQPSPFNGNVAPAAVNIVSDGSASISNATQSEVGAFNFTVTPPANAYFGLTVPAGTSATIGRFIPHHFALADGSALINRAANCAVAPAFTYLGETLNLRYQLTALNASNVRTQNYQGVFARLNTFEQTNAAAVNLSPRTALAIAGADFSIGWDNGQGEVVSAVAAAKPAAPVGPYASAYFGVAPTDSDGVALAAFNLDTNAPADGNERAQIGSGTELRYGRLRIDSVSGPADLALPVPIRAEYWNGSSFVTNAPDHNCTTIDGATATATAYRGALNNGETAPSGSAPIANGEAATALRWSAPGGGNEGSVDFTLDTSLWPWLQFDWNGDGALDTNAGATASFGTYRGSDRIIYWQEVP